MSEYFIHCILSESTVILPYFNHKKESKHLAQVLKHALGHPHPTSERLRFSSLLWLPSNFLLGRTMGCSNAWITAAHMRDLD